MHAYCLFCETQRCRLIAEYISRNYGYPCFSPQIIQRKWIRGVATEEVHQWLPGYLFLYTEHPVIPRFDVKGIIRCLGNGELEGRDLAFAEMIYQREGIIGNLLLAEKDGRYRTADPAWAEQSCRVIKLDRGRRRCCIEFEFDGITRTLWAGYETVDSAPEEEKKTGGEKNEKKDDTPEPDQDP